MSGQRKTKRLIAIAALVLSHQSPPKPRYDATTKSLSFAAQVKISPPPTLTSPNIACFLKTVSSCPGGLRAIVPLLDDFISMNNPNQTKPW